MMQDNMEKCGQVYIIEARQERRLLARCEMQDATSASPPANHPTCLPASLHCRTSEARRRRSLTVSVGAHR